MNDDEQLRYPVGKFQPKESYTAEEIKTFIKAIEQLPQKVADISEHLTQQQLDTPYRPEGWTLRQVLHHLADSHMNAYIRLKWTLTEDNPLIKAYDEKAWAETAETQTAPAISVALLKTLHTKWAALLNTLTPEQMQRSFVHPDTKKEITLVRQLATYAWHGEHHMAHINSVVKP